jgi:tetratricopeptide (TPR) repeat protein
LFGLGAIAGDRGVKAYEDAEVRYPDSLPLHLFQAELLTSMDRIDDAASAYRDILVAFPDTPGVHFLIGSIYRSVHKWEQALTEFRAQAQITPDDERVSEAIDGCLQGAGRFADSYSYLKPMLRQADVPEWALQDFAVAAKNTGHQQEAIAALLRAEAIDASDVSNHYRLFVLYQQTHDAAKAASELALFNKLKSIEEAETSRKLAQRKQEGDAGSVP